LLRASSKILIINGSPDDPIGSYTVHSVKFFIACTFGILSARAVVNDAMQLLR
jgi:hypothetical protein